MKFNEYFGATSGLMIFEIVLFWVVSLMSGVLIIYASIAIGHLFSRHRVLASIVAFIALNTIIQIIFSILAAIRMGAGIPLHFSVSGGDPGSQVPLIHYVTWYLTGILALLSAGYFAITNYILNRRLNLE